jgi:eukaryotic-like serine/threonine-protein kinase
MPGSVDRGQVLADRYRLTEAFAEDPLLEVWLAEDLELRRQVVIKLLLPQWMDVEEMVERFRFEALAAASIVHENVARTFNVEHLDGRLFTVSEYVPGPTVAELVDEAPLQPRQVAAIGVQAAAGLASMHEQGLVHAAVCPQNLVVGPTGRLHIIDFGSVRPFEVAEQLPDPVFPEPGVRDYWPPERLAGAVPDARGDVFSLGLVLWEALAGVPEAGDAPTQGPVRRLLTMLPGGDEMTPRLREILMGAADDDPDHRPRAEELVGHLTEVCGERPEEELAELVEDAAEGE